MKDFVIAAAPSGGERCFRNALWITAIPTGTVNVICFPLRTTRGRNDV